MVRRLVLNIVTNSGFDSSGNTHTLECTCILNHGRVGGQADSQPHVDFIPLTMLPLKMPMCGIATFKIKF